MTMENAVEIPGFAPVVGVVAPAGIYCLCLRGEVVYVGKSTNVYARISRHGQNLRRAQSGKRPYDANSIMLVEFDAVMVKFCPVADLGTEELALIQRLRPVHNRQLNRPPSTVDVLKIPAIAEILSRNERRRPIPFKKRRWGNAAAA